MIGYAVNIAIAYIAFSDFLPSDWLLIWAVCSLAICGAIGLRAFPRTSEAKSKRMNVRNGNLAILYAVLLALPWAVLATSWVGSVDGDRQIILIALVVGMAASGSLLLTPISMAAAIYASTILVPLILKWTFLGGEKNFILAGLATSFFAFLLILIFVGGRMFVERLRALDKIRRSEFEAKMAREEAERATAAKAEFFATMSHEIRTPLNSIIGYTSLVLARQELNREDAGDLLIVRDAGKALLTIVNDILDFSALEAGGLRFIKSSVTLPPLVESCVALFNGEAREKGLQIRSDIDERLYDLTVTADAHRLRQVLLNLANNAVKFTSKGQITVGVKLVEEGRRSATVRFYVSDTGPGIRADLIPNLFHRFSQLDTGDGRRHGGSGLGLAICKSIVEANGGKIDMESREGHGSTFWFEIPLEVSERKQGAQRRDIRVKETAPRPLRVLVVDDVEPNRKLATAILRRGGHDVTTAASGPEAIARIEDDSFDVVLMDVQMPGMDGLTATRAINRLAVDHALPPIIGMTANAFPSDVENCIAAGMAAHVAKPFDFGELLRMVAAVANRTPGRLEARLQA
jgi:signal transduction histidine kinase/CheY-like chemotaxis protein